MYYFQYYMEIFAFLFIALLFYIYKVYIACLTMIVKHNDYNKIPYKSQTI